MKLKPSARTSLQSDVTERRGGRFMQRVATRRCAGALVAIVLLASTWAVPSHAQADTTHADSLFGASAWGAAAVAYSAVVQEDAGNAQAWFRMGFARHQAGDYAGAIQALEKAEELHQAEMQKATGGLNLPGMF